MRILKRNLAFVLALVMALSLTVSAANVKDYKDADDVTFVEAVDVLTSMGVLEGSDGSFNPTMTLNRAEAAKIISYLMLGKTSADNLKAVTAPFNDVSAAHWASGYIANCVNEGIIGGYGNGNFGPNDQLTATQFAKMLLCAVGYGVNGEFTGAGWEVEVNKLALSLGVYNGNLGVNFGAACTREEAALYAFNALTKVKTVKYSELLGSYYTGSNAFDTDGGVTLNELCGYNYKKSTTNSAAQDAFGRKGYVWVNGKNKVVTDMYAADADATYTKKVTAKTLYTDLGLDATVKAENISITIDGKLITDNEFSIVKNSTTELPGSGNGVLTEVYTKEDNNGNISVEIVMINTYLAEVASVNTSKETVTVRFLSNVTAKTAFETTAFEKEDLVLVTIANDEIQTMELAEQIDGELTARSKDTYVKLDGEKYEYAETAVTANLNAAKFDTENTLVVDNYGYALDIAAVSEKAADVEGYVKVTKAASTEDSFGDPKDGLVQVKYFANGTKEVLNVVVENQVPSGTTGSKELCFKTINAQGKVEWNALTTIENLTDGEAVYGYNITDDDEIVLTELAANTYAYDDSTSVNFDAKRVGTVGAKSYRLNAATTAVVVEDGDVDTYEGYSNIDFEAKDVEILLILDSSLIKEVYILGDIGNTSDDAVTIFYGGDTEEVDETYSMISVYEADGEIHDYTVKTSMLVDKTIEKNTAYNVKVDSDGEITAVVQTHGKAKVTKVADDGMSFQIDAADWGQDTWYLADDITVWNVTDGIASDYLEEGDTVSFDVDKGYTVVEIFIVG